MLSLCFREKKELEDSLTDASYTVVKTGLLHLQIMQRLLKKKDIYNRVSSVYKNTFKGDIYDVSEANTGHILCTDADTFLHGGKMMASF